MTAHPRLIYKICAASLWEEAEKQGVFKGAEIDLQDGFIHFSTADQVRQTAEKHFAGRSGLVLACIDTNNLELVWEPSRGGTLFPHLYGVLDIEAVIWVRPLPVQDDGHFIWPELADFPG